MSYYHHIPHAFSGQVSYTVGDSVLEIGGDEAQSIGYDSISTIILQYDPTRIELNRYITTIVHTNGKIEITNSSYVSFGEFHEHNEAYCEFIEALHEKASEVNPNISYHQGTTKINYIFSIFISVFIVVVLLFAIFYSFSHQFMGLVAVKVIVLLFSFPYLITYIKNNRPQPYDPKQIPSEVLPNEKHFVKQ